MNLENLTLASLQQLKEMLGLIDSLTIQLKDHSSASITLFNSEFAAIQHQSQITDAMLLQELQKITDSDVTVTDEVQQLLEERRTLHMQIAASIKKVLPQANSIKSLLANEMQAIKKGRSALSGYNTCANHNSRIISNRY